MTEQQNGRSLFHRRGFVYKRDALEEEENKKGMFELKEKRPKKRENKTLNKVLMI